MNTNHDGISCKYFFSSDTSWRSSIDACIFSSQWLYDNLSRNILEILLEILLDLTLTNDHISVTNLDLQIYLINPVLLLLIHLFIVLMINITVLVI